MTEYFASSTGKFHLVRERPGPNTVETQCGLRFSPVDAGLELNTDDDTFLKPDMGERCGNCRWDEEPARGDH